MGRNYSSASLKLFHLIKREIIFYSLCLISFISATSADKFLVLHHDLDLRLVKVLTQPVEFLFLDCRVKQLQLMMFWLFIILEEFYELWFVLFYKNC